METIKMSNPKAAAAAGLYIHIPFCRKKCRYCDFYSVTDSSLQPGFLKALQREMRLAAASHPALSFDTLYLGGGTPSALAVGAVEEIINAARRIFSIDSTSGSSPSGIGTWRFWDGSTARSRRRGCWNGRMRLVSRT
jgi:coproporphyrinogen III oxidase-like Fe-S oxidoreductase